jgi:hypothetical protein
MSTYLMEMLDLPTEDSDGIFSGEAHEFMQGKVTTLIASNVTPAIIAKGIANFSNLCASYGISRVCAMDGNEDVKNDILTTALAFLAERMDIDVRLFPQYMDYDRLQSFSKKQKTLRAGGCGVCEVCAKRTGEPCRFPEKAMPSLEAYCVNVSELARAAGMKYVNGQNTVTYFGAVLFTPDGESNE